MNIFEIILCLTTAIAVIIGLIFGISFIKDVNKAVRNKKMAKENKSQKADLISYDSLMEIKEKCREAMKEKKKAQRVVTVNAEELLKALNELSMSRWREEVRKDYQKLCQARAEQLAEVWDKD